MERKTVVEAPAGGQDLLIKREFDLPLELLFRAYTEPELIEQWMGTKVLVQENKNHGSWRYETSDDKGQVVFSANGVIHEYVPGQKITRTFQMDNAGFETQLEFLDFEKITDDKSRLQVHIIYRSAGIREQVLKLPFAYGVNMAHNQLQKIMDRLK